VSYGTSLAYITVNVQGDLILPELQQIFDSEMESVADPVGAGIASGCGEGSTRVGFAEGLCPFPEKFCS